MHFVLRKLRFKRRLVQRAIKLQTGRYINNMVCLFERCYGQLPRVLRIRWSCITARYLFPAWECFVPSLGIFHSQCGNNFSLSDAHFSINSLACYY